MSTQQLMTNNVSELITKLASYQMLPRLRREMIIDQAISSIESNPEEKTTARKHFYAQNQLTDETVIEAWCQHYEMTQQQLESLAIRQFKINKFQEITWEHQVGSYFLQRKNQLDRVIYSLIRTKNAGLAQELYFRILEVEQTFAELAKEYSEGAEAETHGFLGPIALGNAHPMIAQKLLSSKPGQLSAPIKIDEWFVIVRLEKSIPAQLDDSMRHRLLHELFETWLHKQMSQVNQPTAVAAQM
ncbi:Peptidylprolyl isomerase (fragment) [Hyella patelloides LEGE 07179]|uniref:peptidylprolyl isomerase n=1 Tax=Hyella patelloides LEGE 07179 TaxID=945734 RepID=A0A563VYH7_9CYAN